RSGALVLSLSTKATSWPSPRKELPIVEQVMTDARRRSDVGKAGGPYSKDPSPRAGRPCSFVGWAPCNRRPSWVTGSDDARTLRGRHPPPGRRRAPVGGDRRAARRAVAAAGASRSPGR